MKASMNTLSRCIAVSSLLLGGCASIPTGPSVLALPGTGKSFDNFRADDAECRQFALSQVGGNTAEQSANEAGIRSAAVGTVVGAVAGAAIGGQHGAGVGAGTGLLVGSMAGASAARESAYGSQEQYDNAYIQCMYARGERVPVPAAFMRQQQLQAPSAPASAPLYPPPPPKTVGH